MRHDFKSSGFDLLRPPLIPAQAGIQGHANRLDLPPWVPAFAGTSGTDPIQPDRIGPLFENAGPQDAVAGSDKASALALRAEGRRCPLVAQSGGAAMLAFGYRFLGPKAGV